MLILTHSAADGPHAQRRCAYLIKTHASLASRAMTTIRMSTGAHIIMYRMADPCVFSRRQS